MSCFLKIKLCLKYYNFRAAECLITVYPDYYFSARARLSHTYINIIKSKHTLFLNCMRVASTHHAALSLITPSCVFYDKIYLLKRTTG